MTTFKHSLSIPRSVYQTVILCVVFNILATVAVILRIRARAIKKKTLQFNDYSIFAALFYSICLAVIVCLGKFTRSRLFCVSFIYRIQDHSGDTLAII